MTPEAFKRSAQFIAKRNVNDNVAFVLANFDRNKGHLTLEYITKASPVDDDFDDCELACTELVAEFPEIRTANTKCSLLTLDKKYDKSDIIFDGIRSDI